MILARKTRADAVKTLEHLASPEERKLRRNLQKSQEASDKALEHFRTMLAAETTARFLFEAYRKGKKLAVSGDLFS